MDGDIDLVPVMIWDLSYEFDIFFSGNAVRKTNNELSTRGRSRKRSRRIRIFEWKEGIECKVESNWLILPWRERCGMGV